MNVYQVTFYRMNPAPESIKVGSETFTQPLELGHTVTVNADDESGAIEGAKKLTQGQIFNPEILPSVVLLREKKESAITVEWHDAAGQSCSFCGLLINDGHIAEISSNLPIKPFICSGCAEDLKKRLS